MNARLAAALLAALAGAAPLPAPAAAPDADLPARWDWREHGGTTPARHFGACDATWCFAAVGAVESMLLIREGRETDLSEQQVLACATPGAGCRGGWMDQAYRFIRDAGVAAEACFPYTASELVTCGLHDCPPVATIAGWVDVPNDVTAIKRAVLEGPVSTVMTMPLAFLGYDGSSCIGPGPATTSVVAVLIVGWDDARCGGVWIAKMCFGPFWGDGGCFTVNYGLFGIGAHAQRPLPARSDGVRARITLLDDALGGGDADSWPEPGETVLLMLEARNEPTAPPRADLRATATIASGAATVPGDAVALGAVPPGAAAAFPLPLPLAIDRYAAPGDTVRVALAFADGGAPAGADTVAIPVGRATVLVVDDDDGEVLQDYALRSVARSGHPYSFWEESRRGPVPLEELRRHRAAVWSTGVVGRLGWSNLSALARWLDEGGRLFINGQDVAWYLARYLGGQAETFLQSYLSADYWLDDAGSRAVAGLPGEPLGAGLAFTLGGPGGSGRQESPDAITPLPPSEPVFEYGGGLPAGVRSEARGRVLFCSFGFEAIDQEAARDTLMARALAWLAGPPPDVSPPRVTLLAPAPGTVLTPGGMLEVRWRGGDDRGVLYYLLERSPDGGATWPDRLAYVAGADSAFAWTVGDTLHGVQRLRVSAVDAAGLWGRAVSGPLPVGADVPPDAPALQLWGAAPNPFNAGTTVRARLASPAATGWLRVYDARGRLVRAAPTGPLAAGEIGIAFDGRDDRDRPLPAGAYSYVLAVPGAAAAGRLAIVR